MSNSSSTVLLLEYWTATSPLVVLFIGVITALLVIKYIFFPDATGNIKELPGLSILHAQLFFTKRYDFLRSSFQKTGLEMFSFRVLHHRVIALSGEEARIVFFNEPSFHIGDGYKYLLGGSPKLKDIDIDMDEEAQTNRAIRQLHSLLRKERINDLLPILFEDLDQRVKGWGPMGIINPFKEVYELVFQMTVRLASCRELAEDYDSMSRLAQSYWDLEQSSTAVTLLLPWLPSSTRERKRQATMNLYTIISGFVDLRRKSSKPSSDAIDVLISEGQSNNKIIEFVLGVIFAGVVNTGMNVCWNLIYLAMHPEWKHRVDEEIQTLISNHTDTSGSEPLHKRLSTIPMNVWEEEMPALDAVIRETLRLTMSLTAIRLNRSKDISIANSTIRKGDFVTYPARDVHEDPEIYPNPHIFDPGRYTKGREEDKKVPYGYVAWGVGRHPCAGMRVAKLEVKIATALLLAGYDYELVNASGNPPSTIPRPDNNDLFQARPIGEQCYMKYRQRVGI